MPGSLAGGAGATGYGVRTLLKPKPSVSKSSIPNAGVGVGLLGAGLLAGHLLNRAASHASAPVYGDKTRSEIISATRRARRKLSDSKLQSWGVDARRLATKAQRKRWSTMKLRKKLRKRIRAYM